MDFVLDCHTHTLAGGHAYSTIMELAKAASEKGLSLLGVTDHAPGLPNSTQPNHFYNLKRVVDANLFGVDMLFGAELNIMDFDGGIDLEERYLQDLDYTVASMHRQCMPQGDTDQNTHAFLQVMKNPHVLILGHPDDGKYPLDYPALVRAAGENAVLPEVNNTSLGGTCYRENSAENCRTMLELCRKEGVPVIISSDAHFATGVGKHQYAEALLTEMRFPEELVVNRSREAFDAAFAARRKVTGK